MKKLQIIAVIIVLFISISNVSAQNGFNAALNATLGSKNSVGLEVGYQYKDLNFYAEATYGRDVINNMNYSTPSIKIGADYTVYTLGKINFTAGAFAGYGLYKGDKADYKFAYIKNSAEADALIVGVRLGAKVNLGNRMFVKAAAEISSTDFDRVMGISNSKGTHGMYDGGLTVGFGVRF